MNAVEAQAHRVSECGTKCVILTQGAQMPEPVAGVTKAGNICANGAPRRRFLAKVLLNNVVGVDTILLA